MLSFNMTKMLISFFIFTFLTSIVSSSVTITCKFESVEFNQTKAQTCIPEPFTVEVETDYAQLSAVDSDCEAFFVENSNSSHLPLGIYNFLPNLKIFLFKESDLTKIHQDSLKNLTNLVEVSFYKNSLTEIKAGIFRDNKLIRKISFGTNNIKSIDADAFTGLKDLREIYLNDNELEALDADLFRDNHELFVVDLESNNLKSLPITIFNQLDNLFSLNLNNNELEALPGRIFVKNVNLNILTFSSNQISKTDIQIMDFFDNLEVIDVLDNPCTKSLRRKPELSILKEKLEENCQVECEDRNKWLNMELDEKDISHAKILEAMRPKEAKEPTLSQKLVADSLNEEDQATTII